MQTTFVWVVAILLFLAQLFLGFYKEKGILRFLPTCLIGAFELLCAMVFFLGKALEMEDSLSFPAFVLGYVGCYWAAAAVVALGIMYIVKRIQKGRKTFVM